MSKLEFQKKKIKDEIITAKKDINDEKFWKYFNDQTPWYLLKDFLKPSKIKMRN